VFLLKLWLPRVVTDRYSGSGRSEPWHWEWPPAGQKWNFHV